MSKGPRKYFTEFVLNIYSAEPAMVSPSNLDNLVYENEEARTQIRNSNIYLILKRPRIAFVPNSIAIHNCEVVGELSVQLEDKTPTFPFHLRGALPDEVTSVASLKYPYTKLSLLSAGGENLMTYPLAFLLKHCEVQLNGLDNQEVVYVGQAFGAAGERSAVKRLSSHSTLQKILADITANEPHMEVLLALYSFGFHRFVLSMDGTVPVQIDGDSDRQHYQQVLQSQFKRSMRISLAEAALIRHFEPRYNKVYKTGFPHQRLKILKKLYDFDFAGLAVEASVEDHGMRLYSEKQSPKFHHIAKFNLHDPATRKSFFFAEP
ncbi:MAG: hypothetical protein PHG89_03330 [Gallionella sp.]|nr:hypothetical protein [Gallionella sp.]